MIRRLYARVTVQPLFTVLAGFDPTCVELDERVPQAALAWKPPSRPSAIDRRSRDAHRRPRRAHTGAIPLYVEPNFKLVRAKPRALTACAGATAPSRHLQHWIQDRHAREREGEQGLLG